MFKWLRNKFNFQTTLSQMMLSSDVKKAVDQNRAAIKHNSYGVKMNYAAGKHKNFLLTDEFKTLVPGVKTRKYLELSNEIITTLGVIFARGALLPKHSHDNYCETIYVLSGSIIDYDAQRSFATGEAYWIPRNTNHTIFSKTGATLIVTFTPPINIL